MRKAQESLSLSGRALALRDEGGQVGGCEAQHGSLRSLVTTAEGDLRQDGLVPGACIQ